MNNEPSDAEEPQKAWWRINKKVFFFGFIIIAAYFLLTEHKAHLGSPIPYLLLLTCVGMHFFMHSGHGNGGENEKKHDHR